MKFFAQILPHAFDGGILRVGFFWVCRASSIKSKTLNVHTFNRRHRADRRVEGLVAGWVSGGMGGRYVRYGWIGGRREKVRGVYGFSSLMKQK